MCNVREHIKKCRSRKSSVNGILIFSQGKRQNFFIRYKKKFTKLFTVHGHLLKLNTTL